MLNNRRIDHKPRDMRASPRAKLFIWIAALLVVMFVASSFMFVLSQTGLPNAAATNDISVTTQSLAQDELPVANAGLDQNVTVKSDVYLNGSASTGFEGPDELNYTWRVSYRENASYLYGMTVSFVANKTGLYIANLTVRDSLNRTDWDFANIVSRAKPKSWLESNMVGVIAGAIIAAILIWLLGSALSRILRGEPVISETSKEKVRLARVRYTKMTKQLFTNPMGVIGIIILVVFIFLAAFGPSIAPYEVSKIHAEDKMALPSKIHWMGTDNFGKDIFSELLYGARTSIIVGVVSALIASFLGAAVGLYSGYVGGWKDELIMRLNDIVLSIPWLVLMIVVAAMLHQIDLTGIILIIGLTGWSTTARMVRAQVLSVKERQYIERARAIGSSEMSIIRRHIFPNTFPLVFANTILTVAVSILSEATLSFLGFRPANTVTWGTMLSFASSSSAFQNGLYWWILAPGFCIVIVVLGFTLLGYALDEILNPKLRHR